MSKFVSEMTKIVIGQGHRTEDAKPMPVILRGTSNPLSGSGSQQPQFGLPKVVTGSPYVANNPLPL